MPSAVRKTAIIKSTFRAAFSGIIATIIWTTIFIAGVALISGCKTGLNETVKDSDTVVFDESSDKSSKEPIKAEPVSDKPSDDSTKIKDQQLIRVEKTDSELKEPEVKKEKAPPPKPLRLAQTPGKKEPVKQKQPKISEMDRVRDSAREIVKNLDTITKIKICHLKTENEWWVTLYDDIGSLIDLKQYIWDPESESLTPFLVLKRIPKSRFESHLTTNNPDSVCEVFDPPPRKKENKDQKQTLE